MTLAELSAEYRATAERLTERANQRAAALRRKQRFDDAQTRLEQARIALLREESRDLLAVAVHLEGYTTNKVSKYCKKGGQRCGV